MDYRTGLSYYVTIEQAAEESDDLDSQKGGDGEPR